MNEDLNITGNIKIIEWLKTEMLGAVTSLFRVLLKGSQISRDVISECLADIIMLTYLLGRRLGIEFSSVDSKAESKLKLGILKEDEIETDYKDLSALLEYIRERK